MEFLTIISSNPCIIYSYSLTGGSYYWVENSKNLDSLISSAGGYLKLSGKYKNYNGITCAVGRAVKVTANPEKYKRTYDEKVKKLDKLKKAIKNYAKFDKKEKTIYLNKKIKIYYWWKYPEDYNNKKILKFPMTKK